MPKALATRAEIEAQIRAARSELIDAEDTLDEQTALEARVRLDDLIEAWAAA